MSSSTDPGDTTPADATPRLHPEIEPTPSADPRPEPAAPTDSPPAPDAAAVAAALAAAAVTPPVAELFDDPFGADEPTAKIEPPPPEASFDDFPMPDTLRQAVRDMGWEKPTAVQAATFAPIAEGKDVVVQSQTGTGKTGAFCLPWLAARFEDAHPSKTGVQLIALTPTRELAKQVCDELLRLAKDTEVVPLPVYGGTAMQPQLAALKAGVHAVVGTPGRVLDHIRRRSLDLSRVQMVVLDEADEMLSMGFLEDIHSILDACTSESRQTTLFSATVPTEIERIARRYMRSPVALRLSGDDIAAAEILHTYYSVTSAVKTRDLLDVIAVEEPTTALVFCNTREEVGVVASVLQREGFSAEPLSSDLTQAARERVLGWMRQGKLRFLVATDVASRGIDISHISHVINYSFPENAESYVHRTGRTGRAGRAGQAISLISPQEIGHFYYLKLQYGSIKFEERHLPPGDELQAVRTELKLDQVSKMFPELVSPEWALLARNLMKDPRGERVIAYLLSQAMSARPRKQSMLEEEFGDDAKRDTERPRESWGGGESRDRRGPGRPQGAHANDRDRGRGRDRDRGPRGEGGRHDGPRPEGARFEGPRADGPRADGPRTDGPRTDGRRFDGPRADGPRADGPRFERPRTDSPRTDESRTDGPRAERPRFDRPRSDRPRQDRDGERREGTGGGEAHEVREDQVAAPFDAGEATEGARDTDAPERGGATAVAGERSREGGRGRGRHRRGRDRERDDDRRDREPRPVAADAVLVPAPLGEAATVSGEEVPLADDEQGFQLVDRTTTIVDEDATAIADPEGGESIGGEPGRRRRRRRRRRRGGQAEGAGPTALPAVAATEAPAGDEDDEDDDDESPRSDAAPEETGDDGHKRRRRRRRGRRRGGPTDPTPPAVTHAVVAPEQPIPQDEILIDIDESELEIVRDAFGEIDELDDFTLKGRRRGVLDTLAEEVELEDLTAKDQAPPPAAERTGDGDGDEDDGDGDGDEDGAADSVGESTTEGEIDRDSDADTQSDDPNKPKRKRRRRRKKKPEPEAPPPLMVPPHKDFWEVWASHFSYQDFEQELPPEPEPEPEPQRQPQRHREHRETREPREARGRGDRDTGERERSDRGERERPFVENAFEDRGDSGIDDDLVTVRLNLGRSHDKKAANIRDLLAEKVGVSGRKVRNLTVGDRDTEFQIGRTLYEKLTGSLAGEVCDGVVLTVSLVAESAEDVAQADGGETGDGLDASAAEAPAHATEEPSDTAPVT